MNQRSDENAEKQPDGFAASVKLPEGHELVIGELAPGTILEVATWQGVGRPDETTNRFLLSADGPGLQKRKRIDNEKQDVKQVEAPVPSQNLETYSQIAGNSVLTASKVEAEPFLGLHLSDQKESSIKAMGPRNRVRSWGRSLFTGVAVIAILVVSLNLIGVGVTVPTIGSSSIFGDTKNSLVLYKKSNSLSIGLPTVAIEQRMGKKSIIFGAATIFSPTEVQVSTTKGFQLANTNTIVGHSFLTVPYLGAVFSPLFH